MKQVRAAGCSSVRPVGTVFLKKHKPLRTRVEYIDWIEGSAEMLYSRYKHVRRAFMGRDTDRHWLPVSGLRRFLILEEDLDTALGYERLSHWTIGPIIGPWGGGLDPSHLRQAFLRFVGGFQL